MTIEFTIPVHPVSKKNSQVIIPIKTKTGKTRHIPIPSEAFRKFEKECLPYFIEEKNKTGVIDYPVNIDCKFYVAKMLRYDLTNLLEAIDDVAVKSGFILDDNRDIIAAHDMSRVFYDKFNPRIEIKITKFEKYKQWKDTVSRQQTLF